MHFLSEYGLFLAKAITFVIAILVAAGGIFSIPYKTKKKEKAGKLTIQNMNDKYKDYEEIVNHTTQTKPEKKLYQKAQKKDTLPIKS